MLIWQSEIICINDTKTLFIFRLFYELSLSLYALWHTITICHQCILCNAYPVHELTWTLPGRQLLYCYVICFRSVDSCNKQLIFCRPWQDQLTVFHCCHLFSPPALHFPSFVQLAPRKQRQNCLTLHWLHLKYLEWIRYATGSRISYSSKKYRNMHFLL